MTMTAGEIRVYLYDIHCAATEHDALTVCQRCGEISHPFVDARMTGTIQVASKDAPREPFLIASTLCLPCWAVWRDALLTDPKYHGMTLTYQQSLK